MTDGGLIYDWRCAEANVGQSLVFQRIIGTARWQRFTMFAAPQGPTPVVCPASIHLSKSSERQGAIEAADWVVAGARSGFFPDIGGRLTTSLSITLNFDVIGAPSTVHPSSASQRAVT